MLLHVCLKRDASCTTTWAYLWAASWSLRRTRHWPSRCPCAHRTGCHQRTPCLRCPAPCAAAWAAPRTAPRLPAPEIVKSQHQYLDQSLTSVKHREQIRRLLINVEISTQHHSTMFGLRQRLRKDGLPQSQLHKLAQESTILTPCYNTSKQCMFAIFKIQELSTYRTGLTSCLKIPMMPHICVGVLPVILHMWCDGQCLVSVTEILDGRPSPHS